jgi:glycosyltransferase involved in cell wall biosynthesis
LKEHSRITLYNQVYDILKKSKIEFAIAAYREEQEIKSIYKRKLTPKLFSWKRSNNSITRWRSLYTSINRWDPDHLLIGGYGDVENWFAWSYGILKKIPITLWTGASLITTLNKSKIAFIMKKFFTSFVYNYICYGTNAKKYLEILGVESKKIRIGINVSDVEFFRKIRQNYFNSEEFVKVVKKKPRPIMVFSGRLEKRKGIHLLLQQLSKFPSNSYYCYVIGSGSLEQIVKSFINSGKVVGRYMGYLHREELAMRLIEADIYISPSLRDPFTRTLSEALACGCFCISSIYDDASYDLIKSGENGYLFDPLDEKDFHDKLITVLNPNWTKPSSEKIASSFKASTEHYAMQVANAVCEALNAS